MEIWKDIPEYETLYAGSNYGRIKAYEKIRVTGKGGINVYPERILKLRKTQNGYLRVNLCKYGNQKSHSVHRLIAEAFIANPDNLSQVCHRDDNKENNCVDNLFWGTSMDNVDDCHNKGRHAKPKRPVIAETSDGLEYSFESTREAERKTGIPSATISYYCKSGINAGGLIWKYLNE